MLIHRIAALNAATRRAIIYNDRGAYRIDCRTINDYPNELLDKAFHAAIGRTWWERDDAIKAAARHLGFRKTGSQIRAAFEKVVRRGVKKGELERDGGWVRRVR